MNEYDDTEARMSRADLQPIIRPQDWASILTATGHILANGATGAVTASDLAAITQLQTILGIAIAKPLPLPID